MKCQVVRNVMRLCRGDECSLAPPFLTALASGSTGALHAKEAALVRILGSLWFNQACRPSCRA